MKSENISPPIKKPRGRPPYQPTPEGRALVGDYASYGVGQEAMARRLGISEDTLRKHYRHELDLGTDASNAKVAAALFSMAMEGNVAAAIFWLKARAGWREKAPDADPNSRPVVNIYNGLPPDEEGKPSL